MREAHIRLGTIDLALHKLPGKIRLETDITLGVPGTWPIEVTPAMIASKVAAGELWVERASPCRLHVDPVIATGLGILGDNYRHERRFVSAVRSCSAWELLGLQLNRCPKPVDQNGQQAPGSLFYITQITNSSSHLVDCHNTPRAEIRRLSCKFCFDFTAQSVTTRTKKQHEPLHSARQASSRCTARLMTIMPLPHIIEDDDSPPGQPSPAEVDQNVMMLVRGSLYTLFGIRKSARRTRKISCFNSPSLLEIAPAAFNMRYLQDIAQRAPLLKSISAVLARLGDNILSSTPLRQEIASTTMKTAETSEHQTEPADCTKEHGFTDEHDSMERIGRATWPILQIGSSYTRLYLDRLPEDRVSNTVLDEQFNENIGPNYYACQNSERGGIPSVEQEIDSTEAEDSQLDIHQVVIDVKNQDINDARRECDATSNSHNSKRKPAEKVFLNDENQEWGQESQENSQEHNTYACLYDQSWQDYQQEGGSYGDDNEIHQRVYEAEDIDGYQNNGHDFWAAERENDMASGYLPLQNSYRLHYKESYPDFMSLAPCSCHDQYEIGIFGDFEDSPERTDIALLRGLQAENMRYFEGYDGSFVDEEEHGYFYEDLHVSACDEQNTP